MIYNEKMLALDEQIDCLLTAIEESASCQDYRLAQASLQKDAQGSRLKQHFQQKKDAYEAVLAYGEYAPGFSKTRQEVLSAKRELDLHPPVAQFRQAETQLQSLLDEIGQTLAQHIDEKIKVDAGNPFFTEGSHQESCGGKCHGS